MNTISKLHPGFWWLWDNGICFTLHFRNWTSCFCVLIYRMKQVNMSCCCFLFFLTLLISWCYTLSSLFTHKRTSTFLSTHLNSISQFKESFMQEWAANSPNCTIVRITRGYFCQSRQYHWMLKVAHQCCSNWDPLWYALIYELFMGCAFSWLYFVIIYFFHLQTKTEHLAWIVSTIAWALLTLKPPEVAVYLKLSAGRIYPCTWLLFYS